VTAVDSNILIYAHRVDSKFHEAAKQRLDELAESGTAWAIPWPCIHEFFCIVTHRKIFQPPTLTDAAIAQIELWQESPSLELIGEVGNYWERLRELIILGKISGPMVHDARIFAICRQHGVRTLWSADRDFSRFSGIKVVNPLQ